MFYFKLHMKFAPTETALVRGQYYKANPAEILNQEMPIPGLTLKSNYSTAWVYQGVDISGLTTTAWNWAL